MSQISGVDFPVSNLIEDSSGRSNTTKVYACLQKQFSWYFGIANYVLIENNDFYAKFMHL